MRTSNSKRNESTKVSEELQEDLALYGITRRRAMEKAPPREDGEANFFGMKRESEGEVKLKFTDNIQAIQKDDMIVSMVAPEDKPFDMLVTTNFVKAIKEADEDDLRSFVRRIVDRV